MIRETLRGDLNALETWFMGMINTQQRLISRVRTRLRQVLGQDSNYREQLLRKMPKRSVCAEIGVWKGDFSERILSITAPRRLHLIDPWEFQSEFPERMYGGAVAKSQLDMDGIADDVKQRFRAYSNVVINIGKSDQVLREFPDQYFDWVYIDGNHYYEFVIKDLEICFDKVKRKGIIAGDDYTWGERYGFPVRQAVENFTRSKSLHVKILGSQFMIRT